MRKLLLLLALSLATVPALADTTVAPTQRATVMGSGTIDGAEGVIIDREGTEI